MKYGVREGDQAMERARYYAQHHPSTMEGKAAKVIIQIHTRNCIEDIVDAAIKSKYQAIIGNEQQWGVTYPILIVIDPSILTPPVQV